MYYLPAVRRLEEFNSISLQKRICINAKQIWKVLQLINLCKHSKRIVIRLITRIKSISSLVALNIRQIISQRKDSHRYRFIKTSLRTLSLSHNHSIRVLIVPAKNINLIRFLNLGNYYHIRRLFTRLDPWRNLLREISLGSLLFIFSLR